jgi:hypothetical protein
MAPACRNACLSISAFVSSRAEADGKIGTRCVKYCHKSAPPSPRFNCNWVKYLQSKPPKFSENDMVGFRVSGLLIFLSIVALLTACKKPL